jgi:mycothiol synthase
MQSTSTPYTIRPATLDDLSPIVVLQQTARTYDFGSTSYTEDTLRTTWQSGKITLDNDTWIAVDSSGAIVAYADLPTSSDNEFWLDIQVLPDHRDQGIEAAILPQIEQRLILRNSPSAANSITLFGRAGEGNQSTQTAFAQFNYERYISFQIMQIDLTEPPPLPDWPEGITVRTFTPGEDEHATYLADEESAEDKGYHSPLTFEGWAERMGRNKPDFDPTLWFLAWDNTDLAAICLNLYDSATNTGWIDHLGVRRAWRKKGLGMALLRHAFAEFYARNITTIKLSVDSGSLTNAPRLYTQAGMRIVQMYHIYKKRLP